MIISGSTDFFGVELKTVMEHVSPKYQMKWYEINQTLWWFMFTKNKTINIPIFACFLHPRWGRISSINSIPQNFPNPAPVDIVNIPLFTCFRHPTSQVVQQYLQKFSPHPDAWTQKISNQRRPAGPPPFESFDLAEGLHRLRSGEVSRLIFLKHVCI